MLFLILFSEFFWVLFATDTSDKDLDFSKQQRLDDLAFTMHEQRPEFSSSCHSQIR